MDRPAIDAEMSRSRVHHAVWRRVELDVREKKRKQRGVCRVLSGHTTAYQPDGGRMRGLRKVVGSGDS